MEFIRRQLARFRAWRAGRKKRALRAVEQDAVLEQARDRSTEAADRTSTLG